MRKSLKKYKSHSRKKIRHNTQYKYRKHKHKKTLKMRGGAALLPPPNTNAPSTVSFNIGDGKNATGTYNSLTDKPQYGAVSYVNSTPQIFLNTLWGAQSSVKNFFNEFFGKTKEYTSSPTDQPIGKITQPYIPSPLTQADISQFRTSLINKYN